MTLCFLVAETTWIYRAVRCEGFLTNLNTVTHCQMRRPGTNAYSSGSWIGSQHWTQTESLPYAG